MKAALLGNLGQRQCQCAIADGVGVVSPGLVAEHAALGRGSVRECSKLRPSPGLWTEHYSAAGSCNHCDSAF